MDSRQQQLEQNLEAVLAGYEGLLGMALVSQDGLPVLSHFTRPLDQKVFSILIESAMIATLNGAAEQAVEELEGGNVERVIVEGASLRLVVVSVPGDLLLVAVTEPDVPLEDLAEPLEQVRAGLVGKI